MLVATLLIVLALMPPSTASTPSRHPLSDRKPCHATVTRESKGWKTSLIVKNDTAEPLTLRASDALTLIEPGKTAAFVLRSGATIVLQHAAAGLSAGEVIATADRNLNNVTLHIAAAAPAGLTGKSLL